MPSLPLYLFSLTPHSGAIHVPVLSVAYLNPDIDFSLYDGLIVTSKKAVDALERIGGWQELPVLCVAEQTAQKVREAGGRVLESGSGYGDDLEAIVAERYAQMRWLYARPEKVASGFAERLRERGITVGEAVVYRTGCNGAVDTTPVDAAVLAFTSPSAVACFEARFAFLPTHRVVVIGRTTLAALPEGVTARMAAEPTVAALVAAGREVAASGKEF